MSESGMRGRVVRMLKPLHAFAVENPIHPGTPDVNYAEGWIELKWLRNWPIKSNTPVPLDHFTQQQRLWLTARCRAGGRAFLLLQVKREWLLFQGKTLPPVGASRSTLEGLCMAHWRQGIILSELITCLTD